MPLHIPHVDPTPKVARQTLRHMAHKSHAKATHNYSVVDDLTQSPTAMSAFEILQVFPSQRKALFFVLRAMDPSNSCLMTFDLDQSTPWLPSTVAFQIPVTIHNITIHQCIIDEGASTCIMSAKIWKSLGSPKLTNSNITLRAFDG